MDGAPGCPVLGDRDPEAEGLGEGAAGGDMDGDGLPQPQQRCVGRAPGPRSLPTCMFMLQAAVPARGQAASWSLSEGAGCAPDAWL